jgi:ribosomal protein S12 methylthiotransferase accessory factor
VKRGPQWLYVEGGRKKLRSGADRTASLQETLARIQPVMGSVGITRVADITGLDHLGVPVAAAYRPNAKSVSVSQGKGATNEAAKVSAIMESIEGYHGEHVTLPLRLATVEEMRRSVRTVDPAELARTRTPLTQGAKLLWVSADDLTGRPPTWLPLEVVHTDLTRPAVGCSGAFVTSSNGLASGNHPLEAVSHAICELIERDANSLWQWSSSEFKKDRRVALETISDATVGSLLVRLDDAEVDVAVWETTSDIGIPSFIATIADRRARGITPLPPTAGSGCHPRREIAVLRAITEAAQGRLTRIAAVREDLDDKLYSPEAADTANRTFASEVRASQPARSFGAAPTFDAETFAEDVAWEIERLLRVGLDTVLVVNLTQAAIGVPVVRAVIPGLEGMAETADYAPGRRIEAWKTAQGMTS